MRRVLAPGAVADPAAVATLRGEGPAAPFFDRLPGASGSPALTRRAQEAPVVAPDLAAALEARQRALGLGPAAEASARALAQGAAVVVAGQQAGLLGGPAFVLHKIAATRALARAWSEATGRRVVPVFWVASEDHDLAEVNLATVIDREGNVRDLSLDLHGDGRSVRDLDVPDASRAALLEALAAHLPATEYAAAALEAVAPLAGEADLGAWSATSLARLLGDAGVVVVEPHVLAPFAGAAYAAVARDAATIVAAVRAAGERLGAAGLVAPLSPAPDAAPLFVRDEARGPRRRPHASEGPDALAALATRRPDLLSGDVVGRVLVQDALFPVLAQVVGPTEALYLAQVREAQRALRRPVAFTAPRPTAVWWDARLEEALDASGLAAMDVARGEEGEPRAPHAPEPRLDDLARLREALEQVRAQASDVAGLPRALADADEGLRRAEEALGRDAQRRAGVDRARVSRARTWLRPKGRPQERVLSAVAIAARYGLGSLREGLDLLDPFATGLQALVVG